MVMVRAVRYLVSLAIAAVASAAAMMGVLWAMMIWFYGWGPTWQGPAALAAGCVGALVLCLFVSGLVASGVLGDHASRPQPPELAEELSQPYGSGRRHFYCWVSKYPAQVPVVLASVRTMTIIYGAQVGADPTARAAHVEAARRELRRGDAVVASWVFYSHSWLRVWIDSIRFPFAPLVHRGSVSSGVGLGLLCAVPFVPIFAAQAACAYVSCLITRALIPPALYRAMAQVAGQGATARPRRKRIPHDHRGHTELAPSSPLRALATLQSRVLTDPTPDWPAAYHGPGTAVSWLAQPAAVGAPAAIKFVPVMPVMAVVLGMTCILAGSVVDSHAAGPGEIRGNARVESVNVKGKPRFPRYDLSVTLITDARPYMIAQGMKPEEAQAEQDAAVTLRDYHVAHVEGDIVPIRFHSDPGSSSLTVRSVGASSFAEDAFIVVFWFVFACSPEFIPLWANAAFELRKRRRGD